MKRFKRAACTFSLLAAASCGPGLEEQDLEPISPEEPMEAVEPKGDVEQLAQLLRGERPIRDEYIVVLKDDLKQVAQLGASAVAHEMASQHSGQVFHTYEHALKGFAVRMPEARMQALRADPRVAYIEENQEVVATVAQSGATWGIDRVDQRDLPLNSTYNYFNTASNVHTYVIDTGVRLTHREFTGRMGNGHDAVTFGGSANDCHGHGTHVAGTVAGTTFGVAKRAIVHPVRVLDCNGTGSNAGVIAGVDWVRANHIKPAVANMSLGGGASQAMDDAVNRAVAAGVVFAVAAGNDNSNACNFSPARATGAITVGSTTSTDARSSFSNFGACVNIWAPGSNITSAWSTGDTVTNTISGTSMASPHVAGAAALYLGANPSATPQQVRDALVNNGTLNRVANVGTGSPNRLLYTAFIGSGGGSDTTAPTTSLSAPSSGSTLTGTVTVSANASDNVGVSKVEFFAGTTLIGSDTTAPYGISWNTTGVVNGAYSLTAKAYDAAGNVGNSPVVSVSVSNSCGTVEQRLANPGFESGNVTWTASSLIIDNTVNGSAPRTGFWKAWLGGYGSTRTDTLYQQVIIPSSACSASFSFWLKITSAETTTTTAYDRLVVQVLNSVGVVQTTLASFSNLNRTSGYVQVRLDLAAFRGQTIHVYFKGTEDSSLQTSFFIDDAAVTITR
jgi:subtilisin family serine protease